MTENEISPAEDTPIAPLDLMRDLQTAAARVASLPGETPAQAAEFAYACGDVQRLAGRLQEQALTWLCALLAYS